MPCRSFVTLRQRNGAALDVLARDGYSTPLRVPRNKEFTVVKQALMPSNSQGQGYCQY